MSNDTAGAKNKMADPRQSFIDSINSTYHSGWEEGVRKAATIAKHMPKRPVMPQDVAREIMKVLEMKK